MNRNEQSAEDIHSELVEDEDEEVCIQNDDTVYVLCIVVFGLWSHSKCFSVTHLKELLGLQ